MRASKPVTNHLPGDRATSRTVVVRLPLPLNNSLTAEAERRGTTLSDVVRSALAKELPNVA